MKENIKEEAATINPTALYVIRLNFLISCFLNVVLFIGAFWSNSYVILSESLQMFVDMITYIAAWGTEEIKNKSNNQALARKLDTLSGTISILLLILSQVYIIYSSSRRLYYNEVTKIHHSLVLICGALSLICSGAMLGVVYYYRNELFEETNEETFDDITKDAIEGVYDTFNSPTPTPVSIKQLYAEDERSPLRESFTFPSNSSRKDELRSSHSIVFNTSTPRRITTLIHSAMKKNPTDNCHKNMNMLGVVLHLAGDVLQALGTVAVALVFYYYNAINEKTDNGRVTRIDAYASIITASIAMGLVFGVAIHNFVKKKKPLPSLES